MRDGRVAGDDQIEVLHDGGRIHESATARGIEVGFNSNAMLLTRARAERLVALGLDWLHVSLDGATAATHEGIRSGADFARITGNLRGLIEALPGVATEGDTPTMSSLPGSVSTGACVAPSSAESPGPSGIKP